MLRFLGALLVVFLIVLGVGYYLNWFNFSIGRNPTTDQVDVSVNVNKERIKRDSDRFDQGVSAFGKKVNEGAREAFHKIHPQTQTIKGDLAKIDEAAARLTVSTPDKGTMTVQAAAGTRIRRNNVNINMGELMEGDHLLVVYREENGKNVAESITVESGT